MIYELLNDPFIRFSMKFTQEEIEWIESFYPKTNVFTRDYSFNVHGYSLTIPRSIAAKLRMGIKIHNLGNNTTRIEFVPRTNDPNKITEIDPFA